MYLEKFGTEKKPSITFRSFLNKINETYACFSMPFNCNYNIYFCKNFMFGTSAKMQHPTVFFMFFFSFSYLCL